jgi:hypothetical protein
VLSDAIRAAGQELAILYVAAERNAPRNGRKQYHGRVRSHLFGHVGTGEHPQRPPSACRSDVSRVIFYPSSSYPTGANACSAAGTVSGHGSSKTGNGGFAISVEGGVTPGQEVQVVLSGSSSDGTVSQTEASC